MGRDATHRRASHETSLPAPRAQPSSSTPVRRGARRAPRLDPPARTRCYFWTPQNLAHLTFFPRNSPSLRAERAPCIASPASATCRSRINTSDTSRTALLRGRRCGTATTSSTPRWSISHVFEWALKHTVVAAVTFAWQSVAGLYHVMRSGDYDGLWEPTMQLYHGDPDF